MLQFVRIIAVALISIAVLVLFTKAGPGLFLIGTLWCGIACFCMAIMGGLAWDFCLELRYFARILRGK